MKNWLDKEGGNTGGLWGQLQPTVLIPCCLDSKSYVFFFTVSETWFLVAYMQCVLLILLADIFSHIWRLKGRKKNSPNINPKLKNIRRKCWSWESSYRGNLSLPGSPLRELDLCLNWLLLWWDSATRYVAPAKCIERENWIWHRPVSWECHLHESYWFICLNPSTTHIFSLGKVEKARVSWL